VSSNPAPTQGSVIQEPPGRFISALEHFFSVASFYPADHSLCREAGDPLMHALEDLASGQPGVTISSGPEGLFLNRHRLRPESPGVALFQKLLGSLGVQRMELSRDLSLDDVHQTVRALNQARLEAESTATLTTLRLQDLPPSVKVVQREFGRGRFKLGGHMLTSDLGGKLDDLADRIQDLEWSDEMKEEFRQQTQAFLARTIERMDRRPRNQHAQDHRSRRSLEEVLLMGATALSHAIRKAGTSGERPNLTRLFRNAAESLALASDTDSVELILEVMNETVGLDLSQPEEDLQEKWIRDDTVYAHPAAELAKRLPRQEAPEITASILEGCLAEEKRTLQMALLGTGASGPWTERVAGELAAGIDRPQSPASLDRLMFALGALLDGGDRRPIDHLLPHILPGLARFAGERLAAFFGEEVGVEPADRLVLIWPHLVGLLLRPKAPANTELRKALVRLVSALPAREARQEAHRLDYLEVVRRGQFGPAIFQLPLVRTRHALRALLSGRQGSVVVQRLQESWAGRPPHPLAGLAGRVLGEYQLDDLPVYHALLQGNGRLDPGEPEAEEFGRRLQACLENLDRGKREADWVGVAIEQLGCLGHTPAVSLLRRIQKERKLGLLPVWPAVCREKAAQARAALAEGGAE